MTVRAGDIPVTAEALGPAQVAALLSARAAAAVATARPAAEPGRTVLACVIGGVAHALPLEEIAGLLPMATPRRVPGAPASHLGLIAARGAIVNILDPAPALTGRARAEGDGHLVLLRRGGPKLALAVDRVTGTTAIAADAATADDALATLLPDRAGGSIALVAIDRLVQQLIER